jgi:endo-1,4-beta-xylanase
MVRLMSLLLMAGLYSCSLAPQSTSTSKEPSLAKVYEPYFKIGAAADLNSYKTHAPLLIKHFNSLTTENEMKFESLQPKENQFDFATADAMIAFARERGMATRGHALVWHRQTPAWVFKNAQGKPLTAPQLKARMCHHITQVMQHFKGKIDAWDVVNEAIMDNGALRTHLEEKEDQRSPWYGIMGDQYIEDAFRCAHQADPSAKLYYNDYYNYIPQRQTAIYNLLKSLKEKGVKIDGVGLQGHLNVLPSKDPKHQSYHQSVENLEKAIKLYASIGLDVQITELDISVYVGGQAKEKKDYYTTETFNTDLQQRQAQRYKALFEMFRRNHQAISSVTFWGIADDNTWLSEFPSGRQDFPMLFDVQHRPKPAFYSVVNF